MADMNPYKPPTATVADVATGDGGGGDGDPVSVAAGNGWEWIAEGFALFKQQPGVWIGMTIAWLVFVVVLSRIPVIGNLLMYVLGPIIAGGVMLGCRALAKGEGLRFSHLFAGFSQNTGTLVTVGVVMLVGFIAIFAIIALLFGAGIVMAFLGRSSAAGGLSLATMGIAWLLLMGFSIPITMAYWFAPALVVFRNMAAVDALKMSFSACLKNIVPFLVYGVIGFVLLIVGSIPLGLGLLVVGPTLVASIYTSYQDIFQG
jgi:uncharacterized membrane protein